jgi:glutamate carboxypeptidase
MTTRFFRKVGAPARHAGLVLACGAVALGLAACSTSSSSGSGGGASSAAGTTVNVGVIRGGSRPNVVAAEAEAFIDVRVASPAEAARISRALRELAPSDSRTHLAVSGRFDRLPMERSAGVASLFAVAQAVARDLGRTLGEGGTGGGSDGNLTAALGVPTLDGLGAVGGGAHAEDEHVTVADLPWRAALLAGLLRRILVV